MKQYTRYYRGGVFDNDDDVFDTYGDIFDT